MNVIKNTSKFLLAQRLQIPATCKVKTLTQNNKQLSKDNLTRYNTKTKEVKAQTHVNVEIDNKFVV